MWASAADFFAMGGYGLYVWGTYGVALLSMTLEPCLAVRRRRRALESVTAARAAAEH